MPRLTRSLPDPEAVFSPLAAYGTVGLAVSGGPDSLALMLLAEAHARALPGKPRFVVYTVDHGLRPEAATEAAFVAAEATRRGLPVRILRWRGRKPATGLQEAARRARYGLIGEAMAADGARVLVTAHHLRDQAETVLMRLAHGSGIEGLRGMDYAATVEGVEVVRPLLGVDPEALAALVAAAGLTAVADPSNADADYERVRWRQVLPHLAALGLTPERLATFARRARDADQALAATAAQAWGECARREAEGLVIDRDALAALPQAVAVRVVGRALRETGADRGARDLARVEGLTALLLRGEAVRTTLHGCLVSGAGAAIRIRAEPLKGARARRARQPAP